MISSHTTLPEHIELLQEKGYLGPNFKTPVQLGYWIKEFQEEFDQCYQQAHLSDQPVRFISSLSGKFNNDLDITHFSFRYLYNPDSDILSLTSLYAQLYTFKRPIYFGKEAELPTAQEMYDRLAPALVAKNNEPLYKRLAHEFRRDKDPDNDYQPPVPGEKPQINWRDIQDIPPTKLKLKR